jgi:hypothetical protein
MKKNIILAIIGLVVGLVVGFNLSNYIHDSLNLEDIYKLEIVVKDDPKVENFIRTYRFLDIKCKPGCCLRRSVFHNSNNKTITYTYDIDESNDAKEIPNHLKRSYHFFLDHDMINYVISIGITKRGL